MLFLFLFLSGCATDPPSEGTSAVKAGGADLGSAEAYTITM
jgi:hypothetical protein